MREDRPAVRRTRATRLHRARDPVVDDDLRPLAPVAVPERDGVAAAPVRLRRQERDLLSI